MQLASLRIDQVKRLYLYIFNADGSDGVRDIARSWPSTAVGDEQYVSDLVWSPDSSRFAFVLRTRPHFRRSGPNHSHLYVAHADGSALKNLSLDAKGLPVTGGLSWSPDGHRLAFQGGQGIGSVDLDLNWSETAVWPHSTRADQQPSWTPDGTRLAWFDPHSIVVSDPSGLHRRQLTRERCPGVQPSWSQDGRRIAFLCEDPRHFTNVFVMNADGSALTQVTHLGAGKLWMDPNAHYSPKFPIWLPPLPPS
jgi:Tol biopolymer transport system component